MTSRYHQGMSKKLGAARFTFAVYVLFGALALLCIPVAVVFFFFAPMGGFVFLIAAGILWTLSASVGRSYKELVSKN